VYHQVHQTGPPVSHSQTTRRVGTFRCARYSSACQRSQRRHAHRAARISARKGHQAPRSACIGDITARAGRKGSAGHRCQPPARQPSAPTGHHLLRRHLSPRQACRDRILKLVQGQQAVPFKPDACGTDTGNTRRASEPGVPGATAMPLRCRCAHIFRLPCRLSGGRFPSASGSFACVQPRRSPLGEGAYLVGEEFRIRRSCLSH
jgi:hypothetical protein